MGKSPADPVGASDPGRISRDKISEKGTSTPPEQSTFETYKEQAPAAPTKGEEATNISPMDLASKPGVSTTPTFQTLLSQANSAQDTLGSVENNLKTPNLKFKKSQEGLLKNKLTDANEHLKLANEQMGAKNPDATKMAKNANPAMKFLGMVTDGQNKLYEAQAQLRSLGKDKSLQPGKMLLIQIKLAQAQQEIEYSSVLLSKMVDALKRVLSTQL